MLCRSAEYKRTDTVNTLEHLRGNPATVTELAESQPVSRPAVSQHLRVLHDSKLVKVTPSGNRRIYSVNPSGLNELKSYLDTFWSDVLDAYSEEIKLMELSLIHI